jgi:hypothetical protein
MKKALQHFAQLRALLFALRSYYMKIRGYFRFFIMIEVGNLDSYLRVILVYFHNGRDD